MELWELSQAEVVRGYRILRLNISINMKKKKLTVKEKKPGPDNFLIADIEAYLVHWEIDMQKHGCPLGHDMIINKSRDIFWGWYLGFFRGNVQEGIGGSCGFPTAYNEAEDSATGVWDIEADICRDGSW